VETVKIPAGDATGYSNEISADVMNRDCPDAASSAPP
jgi:hypothetical protein